MEIDLGELGNQAAPVIDAVMAGEQVVLTIRGVPVAEIVPRPARTQRLSGAWLAEQPVDRSADSTLTAQLSEMVGHSLHETATVGDLRRSAEAFQDLADPTVLGKAWN